MLRRNGRVEQRHATITMAMTVSRTIMGSSEEHIEASTGQNERELQRGTDPELSTHFHVPKGERTGSIMEQTRWCWTTIAAEGYRREEKSIA